MLRTLRTVVFASTLLAASAAAFAHSGGGYGRVVTVEPHVSISFGTGYYDGFRVLYESGGSHYWPHTPYYPGPFIVLPPPHRVQHVYRYRDYNDGWHDRRDRNDRGGWRDDRSEHRRDYRRHERH